MRKIDPDIMREIEALPAEWEIVEKKAHYMLRVGDEPLFCIGSRNYRSVKRRTRLNGIARVRRIAKKLEENG